MVNKYFSRESCQLNAEENPTIENYWTNEALLDAMEAVQSDKMAELNCKSTYVSAWDL